MVDFNKRLRKSEETYDNSFLEQAMDNATDERNHVFTDLCGGTIKDVITVLEETLRFSIEKEKELLRECDEYRYSLMYLTKQELVDLYSPRLAQHRVDSMSIGDLRKGLHGKKCASVGLGNLHGSIENVREAISLLKSTR